MAMSNWDLLAFGPDGLSCNGTFEGLGIVTAEIYKNWIYLHSDKMWADGGSFVKNTIAHLSEGRINIGGLDIMAKRGPQNGIFVFIQSSKYHKEGPTEHSFMAGIGCSAYTDPTPVIMEALGVKEDEWDEVSHLSSYGSDGDFEELVCFRKNPKTGEEERKDFKIEYRPEFEAQMVGVKKETHEALISWIESDVVEDFYLKDHKDFLAWLEKVKSGDPVRFNQGDAFFLGADNTSTPIGLAEPTILEQALGGPTE